MNITNQYPDFEYRANELSKFLTAADMVTIMLKNGSIIHYTPENLPAFLRWLHDNRVQDLKKTSKD